MSCNENKTLFDRLKLLEIQEETLFYFETFKNPKIFLFYMQLIRLHITKKDTKIFFNIQEFSYKFDVCIKTIQLWLEQLQNLELVKFNFKKKQLYFIEILDYTHSKIFEYKDQTQKAQDNFTSKQINPNQNPLENYPNRFFKDMHSILKTIHKQSQKCNQIFKIDNQEWVLRKNERKMTDYKNILIEFENLTDKNLSCTLTYENLTNKTPPPLSNPFHQRMIASDIRKSLELMAS